MQRRLAAIVHADLAGFTRMMEGAETRTFRHLKSAQIEVWRPAIDAGNGRLVGTAGDAMLAEFGSAVTAVAAAIDIQERMARFNEVLSVELRVEYAFVDGGEHQVKNVSRAIQVFHVRPAKAAVGTTTRMVPQITLR